MSIFLPSQRTMSESQFRRVCDQTELRSLPMIEACRQVLVAGRSQYEVARELAVDQGQLSRAVLRLRSVAMEAVRSALRR